MILFRIILYFFILSRFFLKTSKIIALNEKVVYDVFAVAMKKLMKQQEDSL
jgi:hypothetical protein